MKYEYKTVEIANHVDKQTRIINAMAADGWELVEVDFNRGYFKRPIEETKFGVEPQMPNPRHATDAPSVDLRNEIKKGGKNENS